MLRFIPNILTFGRLVLTIVFLVIIICSPYAAPPPLAGEFRISNFEFRISFSFLDIAFVLFVIAGITDMVDGAIARKLNVASKFGRMVDPLVDKVLVCGAFICFAIIGEPKLFEFKPLTMAAIQWSVASIIVLREIYVTVLRHIAEAKGVNFAATVSGKVKMFLQSFAIGTVIIKMAYVPAATWGYWFTAGTFSIMLTVTVVSGLRATQRRSWKQTSTKS